MRLAITVAEISAIGAVNVNINESRSNDAAGGVKYFRLAVRFADAVELSVNVLFAQGEIFAKTRPFLINIFHHPPSIESVAV